MARPRSSGAGSRSTMVRSKDRATSTVASRRAVLKRLRDEEVEHVLFWFTDLEGHLKSFAITPAEMENSRNLRERHSSALFRFFMDAPSPFPGLPRPPPRVREPR